MMSRNSNFNEIDNGSQIILETVCPFCGKKQQLAFEGNRAEEYRKGKVAYEAGYLIQAAFPSFSPDEREFLMTGICSECWDNM